MPQDDWLVRGSTSPADVRRYYDEQAPTYDATLDSWGYDAPQRAAALMMRAWPAVATDSLIVLDAGCGTGLAGRALRDAGFSGRLVGIDLSPPSVALAANTGVYDEVSVGDLQEALAFDDDSVDGVLCVGVLTYVPEVEAVWREFCRVARAGSPVVVTQRDDVWNQRRCAHVLDELERARCWTAVHLGPPASYLPGNPDFGSDILVRYLAARVR